MTLKVVGAGFGRTGTLSLKLALEHLGFGPCHHMVEVFKNPASIGWWEAVADGDAPDWDKVFAGFGSCVDWPSATYWRQIAAAYPEAKVILTVRDPEAWFASTQATIFANMSARNPDDPFTRMILKVVGDLFERRMDDKDRLISVFEAHNAEVRATIPADRLLVYELSQGWAPLCAHLGAPVPDAPMPKVNAREDFPRAVPEHTGGAATA